MGTGSYDDASLALQFQKNLKTCFLNAEKLSKMGGGAEKKILAN